MQLRQQIGLTNAPKFSVPPYAIGVKKIDQPHGIPEKFLFTSPGWVYMALYLKYMVNLEETKIMQGPPALVLLCICISQSCDE